MKKIILITILLAAFRLSAQTITGTDPALATQTYTYVLESGNNYFNIMWSVSNGTINSTWQSGTYHYVSVTWNAAGYHQLQVADDFLLITGRYITVNDPKPPTTVNDVKTVNHNSFTATWNSVAGATGYRIDVSTSNVFTTILGTYTNYAVGGTSQSITGLSANTNYYYRVRVENSYGTSVNSDTGSTKTAPAVPTLSAASAITSNAFTLSWNSVTGATGYRLDVSISNTFSSFVTDFQNRVVTGTSQVVSGINPNVTYYYRVRSYHSIATSGNASGSQLTAPAAPVAQTTTQVSSSSFTAAWTSVTAATGYRLDVSRNNTFTDLVSGYSNLTVTGTSSAVTGLEPATYYFRVRAVNGSLTSINSNTIKAIDLDYTYVRSIDVLEEGVTDEGDIDALTIAEKRTVTQYADGLGRTLQQVQHKQSPAQRDIVQAFSYDEMGREAIKLLPYASGSDGRIKPDFIHATDANYTQASSPQFQFYQTEANVAHDDKPYATVMFEKSPLSRPLKTFGAGEHWNDNNKPGKTAYRLNLHSTGSTDSTEKVIAWKVSSDLPVRQTAKAGFVVSGGYYSTGQLAVTVITDEDGHIVREYTNKSGQVILKSVQAVTPKATLNSTTGWARTYYIYDEFNNLRFVFQPELSKILHGSDTAAANSVRRNNWAFQYSYDARRRMITKKVPGAGAVYMVYDNRDRLVATQDANQRSTANRYWTFTKYDQLNRPVLTGIKDTSVLLTQAQMQAAVDAHYAKAWTKLYETFIGTTSGNIHGYSNKSYPVLTGPTSTNNIHRYLSVTYYDNYNFKALLPDSSKYSFKSNQLAGQDNSFFKRLTGQVTGTKIKVLDAGVTAVVTGGVTWLATVNYYDDDYRVIQVVTDNYKSGEDRITSRYDFSGKVLATKTQHITYDVNWKDITNVALIGNKLVKYDASIAWNAGAASREQLGAGKDGWLEVTTTPETNTSRRIGFNDSNPDTEPANINYLIDMNADATRIYENGSIKHTISGATPPGEVWRIQRTGSTIKYYRNSQLVYTSLTASSSALMVDCSIYNASGSVARVGASFAGDTTSVTRHFAYDHAGRLINVWHRLDNADSVLLVNNTYNELGQLIDKKLHSTDGETFKQSVDHSYNIRGWLTKINESDLTAEDDDASRDLFGMELLYNSIDAGISNTALYSGNISAIKWSNNQALGDLKQNAYAYTYDPMNRIKSSLYKEKESSWASASNNGNAETGFTYDLNGNILTLQRNDRRTSGWMDNLTYDYGGTASNRLLKVTDAGDKTKGFIDSPSASNDYVYDSNGNLVWDQNKGGTESLVNGSFDNGNANWGLTNGGRLTFTNNEVQIATGAAQSILQQSVVAQGKAYVVLIDLERTSGTLEVYVGSTLATFNSTGVHAVTLTSGANSVFSIIAPAGFAGKIKSISLKGVTVITYNFLNLPEIVTRAGDKQLQYIYDASGRKLRQEVSKNRILEKSTDYSGEYIYENDTLQFINHEEGRILPLSGVEGGEAEYQYHLKDHLGNVRLTFTSKHEADTAVATLETANIGAEESEFLYYDEAVKINSTLFDHTNSGATNYATRLTGTTNERFGLAKSISVMPGDTIRASVFAKYLDTNSGNWTTALNNLMTSIANSTAPAGTLVDGGLTGSTGGVNPPHAALLDKGEETGTAPKAYLNFLVFDRRDTLIDAGFVRISTAAREYGQDGAHEELFKELLIKEPGYVYLYLSNDNVTLGGSVVEVFFDDFTVEHVKSPVVQQDDYYAFGMMFNSYQRENSTANQYLYNGKEKQDELDLGWMDYGARMYMADIGRWGVTDAFSEKYYPVSPYVYVANSPVALIDPNGFEIWLSHSYQNDDGEEVTEKLRYENKKLYKENGDEYDGSAVGDPVFQLAKDQLDAIQEVTEGEEGGDEIAKIFSELESTDSKHQINLFLEPYNKDGKTPEEQNVNFNRKSRLPWSRSTETFFNPLNWRDPDEVEEEVNPMIGLLHELRHAYDTETGAYEGSRYVENEKTGKRGKISDTESRAVDTENILRKALGVPRRTSWAGYPIPDRFINH